MKNKGSDPIVTNSILQSTLKKSFDDFEDKFEKKMDKRFQISEERFDQKMDKRFEFFEKKIRREIQEESLEIKLMLSDVNNTLIEYIKEIRSETKATKKQLNSNLIRIEKLEDIVFA